MITEWDAPLSIMKTVLWGIYTVQYNRDYFPKVSDISPKILNLTELVPIITRIGNFRLGRFYRGFGIIFGIYVLLSISLVSCRGKLTVLAFLLRLA